MQGGEAPGDHPAGRGGPKGAHGRQGVGWTLRRVAGAGEGFLGTRMPPADPLLDAECPGRSSETARMTAWGRLARYLWLFL